jgi:hypothetical protein
VAPTWRGKSVSNAEKVVTRHTRRRTSDSQSVTYLADEIQAPRWGGAGTEKDEIEALVSLSGHTMVVGTWAPMIFAYYKATRRRQHDLCGISGSSD